MPSPYSPNPTQPLVAVENVSSFSMVVGLPPTGNPNNRRCPLELRAVPWPDGKRVDLIWRNPDNITRIIIKRGQLGHSAFLLDDKDVIYDGPPIEHFIDGKRVQSTFGDPEFTQTPSEGEIGIPSTEVDLEEDTYYYYTLYMTIKPEPIGVYDFGLEAKSDCQVTGLSLLDFVSHRREDGSEGRWYGEYLYKQFSAETRERDLADAKAKGRGDRGWFQDFCRFAQGALNLYRGHARAMRQLGDVDRTPAGLVGSAFDQPVILAAWARRFNIPPERYILDPEILRRIAASMIFLYKEKGTCPGLVDWTKVLTRWDSECVEFDDDLGPCNPIFLKTWDKQATETVLERQWSLVISTPGQLVIPGAGLTPNVHANSLIVDSMWNQFQIADNTPDTIFLADGGAQVSPEDILSIASVAGAGPEYTLTVTRTSGGPPVVNDNEYNGYRILDSSNTIMTALSSEANDPGVGTSTIVVNSPDAAPVPGAAAAAFNFVKGGDFSSRDPIIRLRVFTRCPTFLYDPRMDVSLRDVHDGATLNPHDILYAGGSLIGVPFVPGDTILTIPDVALHTGTSTLVSGNTLTDTSANFGPNGSLLFARLNPNQNARYYFNVVSNTPTSITVESPLPGVTLENVSAAASSYAVLGFEDWRRYEMLSRLTEHFVPVSTRLFIFMV